MKVGVRRADGGDGYPPWSKEKPPGRTQAGGNRVGPSRKRVWLALIAQPGCQKPTLEHKPPRSTQSRANRLGNGLWLALVIAQPGCQKPTWSTGTSKLDLEAYSIPGCVSLFDRVLDRLCWGFSLALGCLPG